MRRLVAIFDGYTDADVQRSYRVETRRASFSGASWQELERHYSPSDVRKISMSLDSKGLTVRLYLDLENILALAENRLSIEGNDEAVNNAMTKITEVFDTRRTPIARFFHFSLIYVLILLGTPIAVFLLSVLSFHRLHFDEAVVNTVAVAATVLTLLLLLLTPVYAVLWPHVLIDGWGRTSRLRQKLIYATGVIVLGLVINALWLAGTWLTGSR